MNIVNVKILNIANLKKNLATARKSGKKICLMVKADAYGHGLKEVVGASYDLVDFFGVHDLAEGKIVRKLTDKSVLIVGKTYDYKEAFKFNLSITIDSVEEIINLNKQKFKSKIHIKINCGMNRLGVGNKEDFELIIKNIDPFKIDFEGVFTHYSTLGFNEEYYERQSKKFQDFLKVIPNNFSPIVHEGGSLMLYKKNKSDMLRIGIFGYGYPEGKRVMSVCSYVQKIIKVKKGERVGYEGSLIKKDFLCATIPMGYGDGVDRRWKNKYVSINGKKCKVIGNICMDSLMVDVSGNYVELFDKVVIFEDAEEKAKELKMSVYELLTNFGKMRGKIKLDNIEKF